jgi:hypothetical protein
MRGSCHHQWPASLLDRIRLQCRSRASSQLLRTAAQNVRQARPPLAPRAQHPMARSRSIGCVPAGCNHRLPLASSLPCSTWDSAPAAHELPTIQTPLTPSVILPGAGNSAPPSMHANLLSLPGGTQLSARSISPAALLPAAALPGAITGEARRHHWAASAQPGPRAGAPHSCSPALQPTPSSAQQWAKNGVRTPVEELPVATPHCCSQGRLQLQAAGSSSVRSVP